METVIRKASVKRETNETDISMDFAIDGSGKAEISTGIGFFDHMLEQIGKHSGMEVSFYQWTKHLYCVH